MNELYEVNKKSWTRASVLNVNLQMEWWSSYGLVSINRTLIVWLHYIETALPGALKIGICTVMCRM